MSNNNVILQIAKPKLHKAGSFGYDREENIMSRSMQKPSGVQSVLGKAGKTPKKAESSKINRFQINSTP